MPADVEPVSVVLDRPGQPAHLLGILLQHRHGDVALQQLIGGGQAGGAGAHDDDVLA